MALVTINDLAALAAPATTDLVGVWDVAAAAYKKSTRAQFIGGVLTGGGVIATGGFTLTVPATGVAPVITAGTPTMTIAFAGGAGTASITYTQNYVLIDGGVAGKLMNWNFEAFITKGTASGAITVVNVPAPAPGSLSMALALATQYCDLDLGACALLATSTVYLYKKMTSSILSQLTAADLAAAAVAIRLGATYKIT